MNRQGLRDMIISESHRSDMAGKVDAFIDRAHEVVQARFGIELALGQDANDSNSVLGAYPLLYFYPAMRRFAEHIRDWDEAVHWDNLFIKEASRMNTTNKQINGWVNPALHVKNETELALEAEETA